MPGGPPMSPVYDSYATQHMLSEVPKVAIPVGARRPRTSEAALLKSPLMPKVFGADVDDSVS